MSRLSRPQMFMEIAHIVAKRSTCARLNVGAVIVHDRRIVSIGYNGLDAGMPHCSGNDCPGFKHGCRGTTHAEVNAIKYLPKDLVEGLDMYVTDSPCASCYDALAWKFDRVFFGTPYRITEHLDEATLWGPAVFRVLPAGYVIDWRTQEVVQVET